ncbi:MAG: tetratricopeptide repeat protein, partial [Deltaproteobacteria bacterium]|nr:tetratricopeptide repeat protein [Deltaproteobacteria bacterium]
MTLRYYAHFFVLFLFFVLSACATDRMTNIQQKELAQATQRLGEEHLRNGKYSVALKNLLDAEKGIPDDPYLQNSLGLVYIALERPQLTEKQLSKLRLESEKHFLKALDLKPDYAQARNNLGGIYMKQKKWDLAILTYKKVASNLLYATPEMPMSNIGWAYLQQNMLKQAKFYFDKAHDIRPGFIYAVHGQASIYVKQQNFNKALKFIQ